VKTFGKISLRLAEIAGIKTLVEIGAGKGNLTEKVVKQMATKKTPIKLIVTEKDPDALKNTEQVTKRYPRVEMETILRGVR